MASMNAKVTSALKRLAMSPAVRRITPHTVGGALAHILIGAGLGAAYGGISNYDKIRRAVVKAVEQVPNPEEVKREVANKLSAELFQTDDGKRRS